MRATTTHFSKGTPFPHIDSASFNLFFRNGGLRRWVEWDTINGMIGRRATKTVTDRIILAANGIISDETGAVLLILRTDTRTWAAPGGGVGRGELPVQAVMREFAEETGLQVRPGRLTAISFWQLEPYPILSLYFECRLVGGEFRFDPHEVRDGRFFPPDQLPWRIIDVHRRPLNQSLRFPRSGLQWEALPFSRQHRLSVFSLNWYRYPRRSLRRMWRKLVYAITKEPPQHDGGTPPNSRWGHGAFTVIRNEAGAVLWVRRTDMPAWNLPGGGAQPLEAPWETAVRETAEETGLTVDLERLTGVYTYRNETQIVFTFTATVTGGTLTTGPEAAGFAWFMPGEEPDDVFPQHLERVADACHAADSAATRFRYQSSTIPPSLKEARIQQDGC